MEGGEKSREGTGEKQESIGEKLKKIGKRGGHTTPVIPFLRLQQQQQQYYYNYHSSVQESGFGETPFHSSCVSARKLAAILWELHQYNIPFSTKMHNNSSNSNVHLSRIRRVQPYRRHHNHHQHHLYEDNRVLEHPDPSPSSPDLPESAGSLRRHVAASLMQHHRSIERINHAIQPVSPASYGSSMEIAPYNPAVTPTSSIDLKGRIGGLKTSTELLKVLNRIWSLEEQHASNMLLVKALKRELDHARVQIKELVRDQQADRHEIDDLMRQITEDKVVRKSKEQDRITSAIQSVRDELEDERKLRKRSESLHRKLARELYEVKTSLANASKERDREKKSRQLLEDLCDEFAQGIRRYEQELHSVRQKSDKDWTERTNSGNKLILHISEAWLDERVQTKTEPQYGQGDKSSVVEKFRSEIEAFLQSKQTHTGSNGKLVDPSYRRGSLDSIPLNIAGSAPQDEGDDEDSVSSDSHCFELEKPSAAEETTRPNYILRKPALHEKSKGGSSSVSNLQVKFEEQMARASLPSQSKNQLADEDPGETNVKNQVEICEITEEGSSGKKNKAAVGTPGVNSNYMIDELIRSHYLLSESGNMPPENDYELASIRRARASPIRQWTEKLPEHENAAESSTKLQSDSKENTLKAKLLEARTRGQRSRSRLKGTKISF